MPEHDAPMILRIVTPDGAGKETGCDSVQLTLREDSEGKNGGLVGIWRGHAPAVMALGEGAITALLDHKTVFSARVSGGFASVKNDLITVITDSADFGNEKE